MVLVPFGLESVQCMHASTALLFPFLRTVVRYRRCSSATFFLKIILPFWISSKHTDCSLALILLPVVLYRNSRSGVTLVPIGILCSVSKEVLSMSKYIIA